MSVSRMLLLGVVFGFVCGFALSAIGASPLVAFLAPAGVLVVAGLTGQAVKNGSIGDSVKRYEITEGGWTIAVEFHSRVVSTNRAILIIDGEIADEAKILHGTRTLGAEGITVEVGSGMFGECTGVRLMPGGQPLSAG